MPRPYLPGFRGRALDLAGPGRSVCDVAASLGVGESCLHRWRHRDLVDRGLKPGRTAQESAGLAAARVRIRDLEEEVKIWRKAAAAVEAVVCPKERYRLVAGLRAEVCGPGGPAMPSGSGGRGITPGPGGRRRRGRSARPGWPA
jgi:putative transposase